MGEAGNRRTVPSFHDYIERGGSPELDTVRTPQEAATTDIEPRTSWTLEELVRVGYGAVSALIPGYTATEEMIQKGAENVRRQLEAEGVVPVWISEEGSEK